MFVSTRRLCWSSSHLTGSPDLPLWRGFAPLFHVELQPSLQGQIASLPLDWLRKQWVAKGFAMIDKKLLSILVCPVSKGPLEYDKEKQELVCKASGLAYPVRDGIPVMLEKEARQLTADEKLG
jgi:uncharacterized protein YbaR (Trm112 family)